MDKEIRGIDVLLFDGLNVLDLAGPVQAFSEATVNATPAYRLRYVSLDGAPVRASCGLQLTPEAKASIRSSARNLLVPGGDGVDEVLTDAKLIRFVARWVESPADRRILAICSGSLIVAKAGVLDGKRATTHWSREDQAIRFFPKVHWQPDQIYVNEHNVCTSAGVTAGIDLALAEIRSNCGAASALAVARELVVFVHRSGGQSQYSELLKTQLSSSVTGLDKLVTALVRHPANPWTTSAMAEYLNMTPRTLTRRFKTSFGLTPIKFLEQIRVRLSSDLLATGLPVQKAVTRFGFGDFQRMQRAYKRHLSTTVGQYVRRFGR